MNFNIEETTSRKEALKDAKEIINGKFKSSNQVVLEEFIKGEELSYIGKNMNIQNIINYLTDLYHIYL